jgi:hypothetical protein
MKSTYTQTALGTNTGPPLSISQNGSLSKGNFKREKKAIYHYALLYTASEKNGDYRVKKGV